MILTHVDRKSKYTKLAILPDKSAASVQKACDASLLSIAHKIETITYDNGKEFAGHAQIAAKLGAQIYFAKPYHAWERGLNEHTNGLVRQYFPKGSDFSTSLLPMSNGSRTNSTPVPERLSATKLPARFSSPPLESLVAVQG